MKFSVPRTLALTWDFALEHYRENEKTKGPLYGFVEALVSSFLDSTAGLVAEAGTGAVAVSGSGASAVAGAGASAGQEGDKRAISEGQPFMIYSGGRKVPSPAQKQKSFR